MSWKLWAAALASTALLAACGGGGDAGDPLFGDGSGNGNGAPTATGLILTLDKTSVANTGSDVVTATITAVDANRNSVAGAGVQVTADGDAVVTTSATVTGSEGKLTATIGIGANRANRVINVTATSGSATATASFQVVGARIVATLVPAVVAPGGSGAVQYRLTDQSGSPMVGQAITVTAAGFTPAEATGTTGSNGDFVYSYTAPTTAGTFPVNASAGGVSDSQNVRVQSTGTIDPVTAPITSSSVSANPSVVGINVGDSQANRSEIRALFLTTGNVPVKNVRVRFDLAADPNAVGGTFTTGSTVVYSDANGVATSAYVPGSRSSPTDGVIIRACYGSIDSDVSGSNCVNSVSTTLTVTSEPLTVSIGTDATIIDNELSYIKRYLVSVVDSSGAAKADVDLRVSLDLPNFRKGEYAPIGTTWGKIGGDRAVCQNEDLNRNGVLEAGEGIPGETPPGPLRPRASDVSVRLLSSKTDADGTAVLQIQYAKSFATWVDALITVAASGVLGTEGRANYAAFPVPAAADDVKDATIAPPFKLSPYGVQAGCDNRN